jgi:hypothetical protein
MELAHATKSVEFEQVPSSQNRINAIPITIAMTMWILFYTPRLDRRFG